MIFDYSRFMDIRNRDVALPANQYRQFKIVVDQELDDRESPLRELIRGVKRQGWQEGNSRRDHPESCAPRFVSTASTSGVRSRTRAAPSPRTSPIRATGFRVEHDAKEKLSRVEIESRREPLTSLSIATSSRNFSRKARVLVPVERGVRTEWVEVGRGTVVNIQFRAFHRAELRVDFPEQRQEHYRLEIENADNPPLEITAVDAEGPGYRLVFLRSEGRTYRLEYGSDTAEAGVRHGGRARFAAPRLSSREREAGSASREPRVSRRPQFAGVLQ